MYFYYNILYFLEREKILVVEFYVFKMCLVFFKFKEFKFFYVIEVIYNLFLLYLWYIVFIF